MPRAPKACGSFGCTEMVSGRTYCDEHEAERQRKMAAKRGSTSQRGYGSKHQSLRKQWEPIVATGTVTCRRCRLLIQPGEPWDLGHDDLDRTLPALPEHANACNRSAAGRQSPMGETPTGPLRA